jgi:hypothetical protein
VCVRLLYHLFSHRGGPFGLGYVAERAAWKAQRAAWKAQRRSWKAQRRAIYGRSIFGRIWSAIWGLFWGVFGLALAFGFAFGGRDFRDAFRRGIEMISGLAREIGYFITEIFRAIV